MVNTRGARIYRKNLLHRYGWTETSIKHFMPEPDYKKKVKATGHYAYAYKMSRVQDIEATSEFQQWAIRHQGTHEHYEENKLSRKQRRELEQTKQQLEDAFNLELASQVKVSLPSYPDQETFYQQLSEQYNNHLNYLYATTGEVDASDIDLRKDSMRTVNGRLINYLRNVVATYSEPFERLERRVGSAAALKLVEISALQAIEELYPWLSPSIRRQMKYLENR